MKYTSEQVTNLIKGANLRVPLLQKIVNKEYVPSTFEQKREAFSAAEIVEHVTLDPQCKSILGKWNVQQYRLLLEGLEFYKMFIPVSGEIFVEREKLSEKNNLFFNTSEEGERILTIEPKPGLVPYILNLKKVVKR